MNISEVKILPAALMILIVAQATQAGDWPMIRYDVAHSDITDDVFEPLLDLAGEILKIAYFNRGD